MQHAMLFAAPVAGLKQQGMNGPPAAKLVPAKIAPSAVRTVVRPMSRIPNLFIPDPPLLCATEKVAHAETVGAAAPAVYSRIRESFCATIAFGTSAR
jgi:hypothetical protein